MLYDDLWQQLRAIQPDLDTIKHYWETAKFDEKFNDLLEQTHQETFWQRTDHTTVSKELQYVRTLKEQYDHIIKQSTDCAELLELFKDDESELQKLSKEMAHLSQSVGAFKIALLLREPQDASNCFLTITPGAGGTEAQDWADMLLRMYVRFCENNKFSCKMVDYQSGDEAGIKSATLFIRGQNPYGILKSEHGVHRLVRISPYDANKRRHTSFASVLITAEIPEFELTIEPADIRIDTYRAGGAGGQHVNTTDSAVRITHIPTGVVVQCQNERSQLQNKETAMKMLKARVFQKLRQEQEEKTRGQVEKRKIEWGSQIRSYVLHPYKLVKDHRTNYESPQPENILDGEIMPFIEHYLVWYAQD